MAGYPKRGLKQAQTGTAHVSDSQLMGKHPIMTGASTYMNWPTKPILGRSSRGGVSTFSLDAHSDLQHTSFKLSEELSRREKKTDVAIAPFEGYITWRPPELPGEHVVVGASSEGDPTS